MAFLTKTKKTMLIEVRKDILDKAISKDASVNSEAVAFLCELSLAAKRGKHIVYVPSLNGNSDLASALKGIVGNNIVALLKSSQKDKSRFHAITEKLNTKAVCSFFPVEGEDGWDKIIHINPQEMTDFEVSSETHVIGENLYDVKFFDVLFDYFASLNRQKNVSRCYYSLMGGGDTTNIVYENECKHQRHFCLVITDSDFKIPCEEGREIESLTEGSTAKKVLDVHSSYKPEVALFYPMSKVSEIENLIPKVICQENCANAEQNTVLNHDYSFYDMKKGLCYNRLWSPIQYNYWKEVYQDDVDFTQLDSKKEQYSEFNTYNEAVKGMTVLPGWGNDFLKKVMDNPILVDKLRKIKHSDLSASQNYEWKRIGELMYNWTCSLKPRRV